jgi:sec-independent protein translocase protein TatA
MGGTFGWQELLIIAVIVALIFGVGKIADVGPALGKAISGFKRAVKEGEKEADDVASEVKKIDEPKG